MVPRILCLCLLPLALSFPVDQLTSNIFASYSENFARNTMLPLSAAAYSGDPQKCLTNVLGAKLLRQVSVVCDPIRSDTCSGFTAVDEKDQAIIISFRGTTGFLQIVEEVNDGLQKRIAFIGGGQVNLYFNNAFMAVWNAGLKNDFLSLKAKYPNYQLWITGHSLGGSMASLAASYIVANGLYPAPLIKLVTFGQPRTGDSDFAKIHDSTITYSYRVTHDHDLVPHIPLKAMGYTHHKSEIFYKKNMKEGAPFTECDDDESKKCSDGNILDTSIEEHLHYFEHDVSGYGDAGCVGNV